MADRGDPTPYEPEYAELARKFCLLGATNHELADCFDVDRGTIAEWLETQPDFAAGVRSGRRVADEAVARRLFDRAMGCSHEATKVVKVKGKAVPVRYTVSLPPDTAACIAWLRDRRDWRGNERPTAAEEGRPSQPAEEAEPAPPAYNGQNAYNSAGTLNPLKQNAFHCRITGQPGWPVIGRNGLKFPSQAFCVREAKASFPESSPLRVTSSS